VWAKREAAGDETRLTAARDMISFAGVGSWRVAARDWMGKAGDANLHFVGVHRIWQYGTRRFAIDSAKHSAGFE
jgi:hypothetical protein